MSYQGKNLNDYEHLNVILYPRLLRSNSGAGVLHNKHCQACHQRCYIQALNIFRKECITLQVKYTEYLNVFF